MLAHICQGLLRDPEQGRLYLGRQALIAQRCFEADIPALRSELLGLQSDCGGESEIVERRGPEVEDDLPRLPDRQSG